MGETERLGWYLSSDFLEEHPTNWERAALNEDLKLIGRKFLKKTIRGLKLKGPAVVQLEKWRNLGYAKVKEHTGNSGLIRLDITDGIDSFKAICFDKIKGLDGTTALGTKLRLKGEVEVENDFLILKGRSVEVLSSECKPNKRISCQESSGPSNAPKWISVDASNPSLMKDILVNVDQKWKSFSARTASTDTPWAKAIQPPDDENNARFNNKRRHAISETGIAQKRPRVEWFT